MKSTVHRRRHRTSGPAVRTCLCTSGPAVTATWRDETLVRLAREHWPGCPMPDEELDPNAYLTTKTHR